MLADALKTHARPEYLHSVLEEYAVKLVKAGEELAASGSEVKKSFCIAPECCGTVGRR